jgi:phosphoribosylformylglycinamidine cyclo-ligase
VGEVLLEPTRIYVKSVQRLVSEMPVHALCHITGGGLPENLPRVLPADTGARIRLSAWQRPAVFDWLQIRGGIEAAEMLRTFNCGIGMVACVPAERVDAALDVLAACGESAQIIGEVVPSQGDDRIEFVP